MLTDKAKVSLWSAWVKMGVVVRCPLTMSECEGCYHLRDHEVTSDCLNPCSQHQAALMCAPDGSVVVSEESPC